MQGIEQRGALGATRWLAVFGLLLGGCYSGLGNGSGDPTADDGGDGADGDDDDDDDGPGPDDGDDDDDDTCSNSCTFNDVCGDDVCSPNEDDCNCPQDCDDDPWACSPCECGGLGGFCWCSDFFCDNGATCCANGPC